jgi:hypothetical protein
MTAAAAFAQFGVPFVVSDVLVIGHSTAQHEPIATYPRPSDVLPPGKSILDPVQKTYILANNLCVAMAGDRGDGKVGIRQLAARFGQSRPCMADLTKFLTSEIDRGIGKGFGLVGWLVEGSKAIAFKWHSKLTPIGQPDVTVGEEFFIGSGADILKGWLRIPSWTSSRNMESHEMQNPTIRAQADVLCTLGKMLMVEMTTGMGLEHLFGGGFQVSYFDGAKFVSLDRYIVVHCHGSIAKNRTHRAVTGGPYLNFEWVGTSLTIRRFDIRPIPQVGVKKRGARIKDQTISIAENALHPPTITNDLLRNSDISPGLYIWPIVWRWYDGTNSFNASVFWPHQYEDFTFRLLKRGEEIWMYQGQNMKRNYRYSADISIRVCDSDFLPGIDLRKEIYGIKS